MNAFFRSVVFLLTCLCIVFFFPSYGQVDSSITSRLSPPSAVSDLYDSDLDTIISDDFNGSDIDWSRWQYRYAQDTTEWGTSSDYVFIDTLNGDSYLSVGGSVSNQRGSGISNQNTVQYGFYILKWRMKGYEDDSPNGWHPSVWAARCDFSHYWIGNCAFPSGGTNIEIDLMEGFQDDTAAYWESHLLPWNNSSITINIHMTEESTTWPHAPDDWEILGLEYTDQYMRLWRYDSGWQPIKTVPFTKQGTNEHHMFNDYRTEVFWIMSNKLQDSSLAVNDSWLQVDYFYRYEYLDDITAQNEIVSGDAYRIKNYASGKYLRGYDPNLSNHDGNNAYITQQSYESTWSSEKWTITEVSGEPGVYKIKNHGNLRFMRGYDPNHSEPEESFVTMYSDQTWPTLKWRVIPSDLHDYFYLQSINADNYLRGYNPDSTNADGNGSYITMHEFESSWNSLKWKIEPVSSGARLAESGVINKETLKDQISTYPNPAVDYLIIDGLSTEHIEAELFELSGKKVELPKWEKVQDGIKLDISQIEHGVYLLKISNGHKRITKRVIL